MISVVEEVDRILFSSKYLTVLVISDVGIQHDGLPSHFVPSPNPLKIP